MQESKPAAINEQKDYSSLLAVREYVDDLVKNCFSLYDSFMKAIRDDEAKNEPLKTEYREYKYYHDYQSQCQVYVRTQSGSKFYKDFANYSTAATSGIIQGIDVLEIKLNLSYKSGKFDSLIDHEHEFIIKFRPENSEFIYNANYDDSAMNSIRDKIAEKLDAFPATNTIFTKAQLWVWPTSQETRLSV